MLYQRSSTRCLHEIRVAWCFFFHSPYHKIKIGQLKYNPALYIHILSHNYMRTKEDVNIYL